MDPAQLIGALILGLIEGLTEFIPVSSTGHLILAIDILGFKGPPGKVFEIVIQLGAICAVCIVYWRRLLGTVTGVFRFEKETRFVINILFGFVPALVVGFFAHGFIKSVLFNPYVVSVALVVGGFAILAIERWVPEGEIREIDELKFRTSLKIGIFQCVAMIPGVSRSGATIMGARLLGVQRATATEFSFFLAVPTMIAATAYDIYKNWGSLTSEGWVVIAVGFITAFVSAALVVDKVVAFVSRHGFAPFAWYRIVLGTAMLALLVSR